MSDDDRHREFTMIVPQTLADHLTRRSGRSYENESFYKVMPTYIFRKSSFCSDLENGTKSFEIHRTRLRWQSSNMKRHSIRPDILRIRAETHRKLVSSA